MKRRRVVVMPDEYGRWEVWDGLSRWDEFWMTRRRWGWEVALRGLWNEMTHKTILREDE